MTGWLIVFVLLGVGVASGQPTFVQPRNREPKVDPAVHPLLDPDRSSVYMEFRKVGKCPPANRGDKNDRIWLALKNNTRWQISVLANGVESECYGDASIFYRVEQNEFAMPDGPIPHGHWLDVASRVEIEPGDVLNFSVPKTHLDPGLSIRVDFEFTWEKNNRYTRHSSCFSYWDLPSALHDKAKEKKLRCVSGMCVTYSEAPVPQPSTIPLPPSLTVTPQILAPTVPQPDTPRKHQ
ncbi:MAG TPA: hypothetical protein VN442_23820 [Bryobacteraceae bacterium]|nr:hypothetical protein [Bryobacteraceae bacterium]